MRIIIPVSLLLVLITLTQSWSADWPQFRGINADGTSQEKIYNTDWKTKSPKMVWKVDMSDDGYSGPSVVGNKVYIIDHVGENDVVRCINLKNGGDIWKSTYPNPGPPDFGFTRATPAVKNGFVVTLSRKGLVVCMDAKTGNQIWKRDTFADYKGPLSEWGHGASILIDGNRVIVVPGGTDACIVALDLKTGKTIWTGGGSDTTAWTTPVAATINGIRQYIALTSTCLTSVDAKDGHILWQFEYKTLNAGNIASPIVNGNKIFITASYNMGCTMLQIGPDNTPVVLWRNKAIMAHFNTPVYLNGYIYGISDPENLVCLDAANGEIKWIQGGFEKGPIISVGGYLLATTGNTGRVCLIKPDSTKYNELSSVVPLGGQSWSPPIYANGYLLIRNQKALACLDINMKPKND